MKHLLLILTCLLGALGATAQGADPDLLARRATAFFDQHEWLNAAVTYERLLRIRPGVPDSYGRGIAAAGIAGETDIQLRLTRDALDHAVPVDSLFNTVRTAAFTAGHADAYEHYMLTAASQYPWMSRMTNVRLLDYYDYRSDGPAMTRYALRLLSASPNSLSMLAILARGYLLQGEYDHAVAVYNRMLTLDPSDSTALLYLANYYADRAEADHTDTAARDRALQLLRQAYDLRPAPYIRQRINILSSLPDASGTPAG